MRWDLSWKYPLLLDDPQGKERKERVVAKDNSPSPEGVVAIPDRPTKEAFIKKCEKWWGILIDELDYQDPNQ